MLKVLHITERSFPPAIRVMKESVTALENNYEVAVLCPSEKPGDEEDVYNNIKIFRSSLLRNYYFISKIILYYLSFELRWFFAIKETFSRFKPDIIHVHDIWLHRTLHLVCLLTRQKPKIILDLHENMPSAVVEYRKGAGRILRFVDGCLRSRRRIMRYEKSSIYNSDVVLVVVDEAKSRLERDYLNVSDKIKVVENFETLKFINKKKQIEKIDSHKFRVVYIGGVGPHRGVDTLIQSAAYIKDEIPEILIEIVGVVPNKRYSRKLKESVSLLGVSQNVKLIPWINSEDVYSYMYNADVGVVPHYSNDHTDTTIPHKLYQYMMAKLPLIVSSSKPLKRVIDTLECGVVFEAGDAKDLAKKIKWLYANKNKMSEMANSGFEYTVHKNVNWENKSAIELLDIYSELIKK